MAISAPLPPGPRGNPLTGVLGEVRRDPISFLLGTRRQYGDVAAYRLGPLRSQLVSHPDGIRHVLQENVKNYTKEHFSYSIARWVVGDGLLTSEGDHWLRQRRLAQPAFHRQRIAGLGTGIVAAARDMVAGWERDAAAGRSFDVGDAFMAVTLRVVGQALFGSNVGEQAAEVGRNFNILSEQTVARFRTFNVIPPVLPTRADREFRSAQATLRRVVGEIIAERRRTGDDRGDLLSMLMLARDEDTGEGMSDADLSNEVLTMLLAGHETTATALTWAVYLLDRHPEAAQKLYAEVDAVLGDRPATFEDYGRLSYTRMVIDETLRLYPPVYILSRAVKADDVIGGYRIARGSAVDISPYVTHRHPDFWDEPEAFRPERFAPEAVAKRHKQAYFPFLTGPRMCIGQSLALVESALVLATVAQRFRLRLARPGAVAMAPLLTLRPLGGMPVVAEARVPALAV